MVLPELKESDDSSSPLLYEVNTYYAGKITFFLPLKGKLDLSNEAIEIEREL